MRRRALIILGIALLASAAVWHFAIGPRYRQRLPEGWTWTSHFVGVMTYADPKSGLIPDRDALGYYDRSSRVTSLGDPSAGVLVEDVYTVRDPETKNKTWEYVSHARVDPRTGAHLAPEYAGQHFVFPRGVEKASYRLRQSYLEGVPVAFQREERIEEVLTYVFVYRGAAEYTESYTTGSSDFPRLVVPEGQEIRCADDQFLFRAWVEPVTGEIVKQEESCHSGDFYYDVKSGQRLAAIGRWAGVSSGDDMRQRLQRIRAERSRVLWTGPYAASALLGAGVLVLGWGLRRRRMTLTGLPWNRSVTTRWIAVQLIGIVVIVAMVGFGQFWALRSSTYDQIEQSGRTAALTIQQLLAQEPDRFVHADLQPILLRIATSLPNTARISVIDSANRIVADSDPDLIVERMPEKSLDALLHNGEEHLRYQRDGEKMLRLAYPLEGTYDPKRRSAVLGAIVFDMRLSLADAEIQRFLFRTMVAFTLLIGAFWVALHVALNRPFFRRLHLVNEAAEGLGAGNLSTRLLVTTEDELGRLSSAFNQMAARLETTYVSLNEEIDARQRAEIELRAARDGAIESSRAKAEFLANMSHEIRTPMNGVIGMTDLVLDSELTAEQRDSLTTVRTSADTLLSILNDILDFSKIESRKLTLEAVPFSPRTAIADVLKPLAFRAHQKGLELLCDIDPTVPAFVLGDPTRLQQVLTNLVGNALKFTEHGHVVIAVREDARTEDRTTLHVSVTDTGIGIPPEQHDAIFEAFRQADGSTTRRFGGTGLGLTISSTLVRLMGGRIWVESEPGVSSTFHFTVTLAVADAPDAPEAPPADSRLSHLSVLIVDDNDVNQRIVAEQVRRWGMSATVVASGRAALDALTMAAQERRPFELILLDANMPDMDGFEVAEEVSKRPELASPTVMMLSSSGEYGEQARCVELGVAAYLTKPVYAADLLAAIERAIGSKPSAAVPTAQSKAGALAMTAEGRSARILLVEDNVVNQRVAYGLLTRRGHHVAIAQDGREALDQLDHEIFDLVLMDLQMPVMGGLEATAAIRRRERGTGQHIRIVAMTAHAMHSDRERCLAAGMDGYLSKPIDPGALFALVEQDVEGDRRRGNAQAAVAMTGMFDEEALRRRLSGDNDLMADVTGVFLEDLPVRLEAIRDAVTRRDAEALRAAAHALKGAAATLSAVGLFEAAQVLERVAAESHMDAAEAAWWQLSVEASNVTDLLHRRGPGAHRQHRSASAGDPRLGDAGT